MAKRQYKAYTDEDLIKNAKDVKSIAGLLESIGLRKAGGNYYTMKRHLQRLQIDTSHWTGQGWSKGEQLKDWSDYTKNQYLKPHIIKERGHQCEECKRKTWMGDPIALELHHKDGNRTNNETDNLQLLCPNCHAQTNNYKSKNFN